MTIKPFQPFKLALTLTLGLSLSAGALAQQTTLENEYPELANYFNGFVVVHAEALDAMADINDNRQTRSARDELRQHLDMMKDMDHMEMMAMNMHGGMDMGMGMGGPHGEFEANARMELGQMLREQHSTAAARDAYENADALPHHAAMVLAWGAQFERELMNIWAHPTNSVEDKQRLTGEAINDYRTGDDMHAIAPEPKPAALYLDHEYATGLKTAFPRISGLLWSNQWLQLAALEALILGQMDEQFAGRVDLTLERYNNKLGSDTGMSVFPPPVEMPSAPAIAPSLYTVAPEAAIIMDNLNMLETAIGDIIAYPNLSDSEREEAILEAIEQFTTTSNTTDEMNYLLSALRGGIYNQGGPAIGELTGSERNRSRQAMDMQHNMIMSGPN